MKYSDYIFVDYDWNKWLNLMYVLIKNVLIYYENLINYK